MRERDESELLTINTIRTLSMDAVETARSGHPGTPMAMAPVVYSLWQHFLRYDPEDPIWPDRDRFVLSMGHASMLLYSILHLCGVKAVNPDYEILGSPAVSLEDIKNFRQLNGKCPGHPEYRWTSGIETTTGPLGQGVASSVGMAIASRWLAKRYNRPEFPIFGFNVYALASDGDLMEGLSSEAASLAGHLGLSNLCWIYDDNGITIEGRTDLAFSEDVPARFRSYGWRVLEVNDANDVDSLDSALRSFEEEIRSPTLIAVKSHIGYGSPGKQNSSEAHGSPLGEEEVALAKKSYGWSEKSRFYVPQEVREHLRQGICKRGGELRQAWRELFLLYRRRYPDLAEDLERMHTRRLPEGWDTELPHFSPDDSGMATRDASSHVLNVVAGRVPWLLGGSADLSPSTKTRLVPGDAGDLSASNYGGRNLHFGIREHAMASILNGLALSKLRAFGSTFLTFSDYAKPAIRLSAMMEIPVIYILTHDSIGLGEDGPTHQPVEHLASLRAIPNLIVIRPADANEVTEAWRLIMEMHHEPAALILTRQKLPILDRSRYASAEGTARGAYILADAEDGPPQVLLMASGSEVHLCIDAYETLRMEGIRARVISMPSWEIFERQDKSYRESIIPPGVSARIAVEQGSALGWHRYLGTNGKMIGMHTFGASAPLRALQKKFGFTPDNITTIARSQITRNNQGTS